MSCYYFKSLSNLAIILLTQSHLNVIIYSIDICVRKFSFSNKLTRFLPILDHSFKELSYAVSIFFMLNFWLHWYPFVFSAYEYSDHWVIFEVIVNKYMFFLIVSAFLHLFLYLSWCFYWEFINFHWIESEWCLPLL